MTRARGLLLGGACFATAAAFTIAVSSSADLSTAGIAHGARPASISAASRIGVVAAMASGTRIAASGRDTSLAFVGPAGAPERPAGHLNANVPLIPSQVVDNVMPNAGASGAGGEQAVVITGSGFTGATDVFFGSTDVSNSTGYPCLPSPAGCFQVVSDTEIDADTPMEPAGTGTVDVTVDGAAANGPADNYSYFDPPTVTNVPTAPQAQGSTGIAVAGTNFSYPGVTPLTSGVSEVDLNPTGAGSTVHITALCGAGTPPDCFAFEDDSDLTIDLPNSMAAGTYDTEVITPGGTSATSLNDQLVVLPPSPTLTNLNPSSGSTAGGNNVTLTGTFFTGATDVNWGAVDISTVCGSGPCFTVDSDTQITVDGIPNHGAGGVSVTVTTPSGTSGSKPYTYVTPTPTLTNLNPSSGSTLGGNNVTLTGTFFTGATDVNWGAVDISTVCGSGPCFTVDSDTQITVDSIPNHGAGGVSVTVRTPGGTTSSKPYTYVTPPPTLTNLNPSSGSGSGGNDVVLTGTNFTGATDVNFGASDIQACGAGRCFDVNSPTQITVRNIPSHPAGIVNVSVTTPGVTSGTLPYTYLGPTLTSLLPTSGSTAGGNNVTVTGTLFTGATDVNWGALDISTVCGSGTCFTVNSDTQITVDSIPSHGGGGVNVHVVTPGGTTNDLTYTYVTPPPTLTLLNPSFGSTDGGNSVVLTGTNLTGATDVHIGTSGLTMCGTGSCFTIDSDTQITATMPANVPGNVSVNVTTPGGTSGSLQYTYNAPAPTVTHVLPNEGAPTGQNSVALTGTAFEAAGTPITSQVTVGTAPITLTPCGVSPTAPCFTVKSATSINIGYMPVGTAQVNITVMTLGGTSPATSQNAYTYSSSFPSVTELLPKDGATGGGEAVSLFGSGFGQAGQDFVKDVFFGATDVPSTNTYPCPSTSTGCFIVVGPTQLAIYTPANAAGTVHVTVNTPIGTSSPGTADEYTFVAPGAYTALTPYRVCDTRPPGGGISHNECNTGVGSNKTLGTNGAVTVQITSPGGPVPSGAQAVVVNVTAIDQGSGSTFVTAYPAGASRPVASNINLAGHTVEANLVIVQLSSVGGITLFNAIGSTDVIVDVEGYFAAPSGSAGEFHSIPPLRICDSRAGAGTICAGASSTPLQALKWRDVVLSGLPPGAPLSTPSIPATPGTAAAAVFNLTAVIGTQATYLTVAPALAGHTCPTGAPSFSNVNPSAGIALPNRVISSLGPNQDVCIFSAQGSINFVIDVNGWFGSAGVSGGVLFYSVPPTRVCDTRSGSGTACATSPPTPGLGPGQIRAVAIAGVLVVPADNAHSTAPVAVVANLTGVVGTAATVFTLFPSDAARPRASDLNPSAGEVIANLAIVGLSTTVSDLDGDVSLYNNLGDINAILDVAGWFQ